MYPDAVAKGSNVASNAGAGVPRLMPSRRHLSGGPTVGDGESDNDDENYNDHDRTRYEGEGIVADEEEI